ncbi:MAG: hybrid sensor histidine kinase/response regulator [Bacteroidales bacterium]|nr:hybrid sensor histidine kinase/response regulator [Bacteroidales bacterium]
MDKNAKILIVDDNPKNLQVLGSSLRSFGHTVEFSTSGTGALEWLKEEKFDLILLDIMMPEMDGYETCRRIRENFSTDTLPVLFLTAKTDKQSIIRALNSGAQDYITKPFDAEELMARVNTQLELKSAREALKNINQQLEQEVKARTLELAKANSDLLGLDQVKSQFLNMLSHEIRTPLNGIKGSVQLLKTRIESEELIQFLNILDTSVSRLENFTYTALLITRLNSNQLKIQRDQVNIKEQIEHCLIKLSQRANKEPDVEINFDQIETDKILADKDLFHELLMRILENSIKYTSGKALITIKSNENGEYVNLQINDNGKGFPEKILKNEIKMFSPGEDYVNKNTGLNLYLARLIVEYHKGKIIISNLNSGGASVSLLFPYK